MSWLITPEFRGQAVASDADAQAYLRAVEIADQQPLEAGVVTAVDNFVVGCKADGIWSAIKASCILAGARTLAGALVPLVGTAPTNFNFVAGDYDRETGLVGDGSTKYLDSNRNNNHDPQDSNHNAVYVTNIGTTAGMRIIGGNTVIYGTGDNVIGTVSNDVFVRQRNSGANTGLGIVTNNSLLGVSRSASASYIARISNTSTSISQSSQSPSSADVRIFGGGSGAEAIAAPFDGRLAFYSIGESLDLTLLDARVTTLMSDLAAAIP
jgi:hypothetical protein